MSQENIKYPADKMAAKKAAVLGAKRSKKLFRPFLIVVLVALAIAEAVYFLSPDKEVSAPATGEMFTFTPEASEVDHSVSDFDDGQARFYRHDTAEGVAVRYFILKSSDGVLRAAFDACDACWREGKGYRQEDDEMVCQSSRMRFASMQIGEVKGGCNPAPLASEVRGDEVVIRVADLAAGARYFDASKEKLQ